MRAPPLSNFYSLNRRRLALDRRQLMANRRRLADVRLQFLVGWRSAEASRVPQAGRLFVLASSTALALVKPLGPGEHRNGGRVARRASLWATHDLFPPHTRGPRDGRGHVAPSGWGYGRVEA